MSNTRQPRRKKREKALKAPLSARDNKVYQILRDKGVLKKTTPDDLGSYSASLAIVCFDPQCFGDIYGYHQRFTPGQLSMGTLGHYGGLLLVPESSCVRMTAFGEDSTAGKDMVKAADLAFTKVGVGQFNLYGHATCVAASEAGLNFLGNFALYVEAVGVLRTALPGADIRPFFHVSRDQKQKTWGVDENLWEKVRGTEFAIS